ncbi:DEFGA-like protein [Mya arenaria]|uniref:DEFGA-like protein n=1 Tax=Mya arenaria TaxID=6604 RepID=A0ABY7EGG8_MYAAR|nr:defensin gallicin-like [Mya arenaria]XP_052809039.1 defensin gallicin-like [Mya arenaria]WAR07519.1 DEFGA-like protein [Mya arenaria]
MKTMILIVLVCSLVAVLAAPKAKRLACAAGELGCAAYCATRGNFQGGCCGKEYTNCHGTCYCNGSGLEYRCYNCDL